MVIGVDASRAVMANKRGVEYYGWYLLRALLEIDQKNQYRLYAPHLPHNHFGEYPNAEWKILPAQRLWSQYRLAKEVRSNPPDVLFVPSHVVPLLTTIPAVVTIHDLAYKYFPEAYPKLARRYLDISTGISASKAKKIIVPSQATADDLVKFYKVSRHKIALIPHGFDSSEYCLPQPEEQSPHPKPYVYFVGRLETRKNVVLLIDAFALLAKEIKDIELVLAGKPGEGYDKIEQKLNGLPQAIRSRITLAGYLSTDESARYMRHAKIFAFPSLYEGFGIPLLEAFASGTPTISSNAPPLPEVAGDAAMLLPPQNALSWAAAMSRIIHQKEVGEKLTKAGLERVKNYSWNSSAQATLEVIEHASQK